MAQEERTVAKLVEFSVDYEQTAEEAEMELRAEGVDVDGFLERVHKTALALSANACLRCAKPTPLAKRRILSFFNHEGREDFAVALVVCVRCSRVIATCLEKGTTMTPIVEPPDPLPKTLCAGAGCSARTYGGVYCGACLNRITKLEEKDA